MILFAFALFAVLIAAWLMAPASDAKVAAPAATPLLNLGESPA